MKFLSIPFLVFFIFMKKQSQAQHFTIFDTFMSKNISLKKMKPNYYPPKIIYYDMDSIKYKREKIISDEYNIRIKDFSPTTDDSLNLNSIIIENQEFTFATLAENGKSNWRKRHLFNFVINQIYEVKHKVSKKKYIVIFAYFDTFATTGLVNQYIIVFELDNDNQVQEGFLYNTSTATTYPCLNCISDINSDGNIDFIRWNEFTENIFYYNFINGDINMLKSNYKLNKQFSKKCNCYDYNLSKP